MEKDNKDYNDINFINFFYSLLNDEKENLEINAHKLGNEFNLIKNIIFNFNEESIKEYINTYLVDYSNKELLIEFISNKYYKLSTDLLTSNSLNENIFALILCKVIEYKSFENEIYMYSDYECNDLELLDCLKQIEREIYILIRLKLYDDALERIVTLKKIYLDYEILPLHVINELLKCLLKFSTDTSLISKRCNKKIIGDVNSVIYELFLKKDFYRINEISNKLVYESTETNYRYLIFQSLGNDIMFYNERNKDYLSKMLCYQSTDNLAKFVDKYSFSSFDLEFFNSIAEDDVDKNINYYELYIENYKNGNYKEALKNIKCYKKQIKGFDSLSDISYLVKELEIKIINDSDNEDKKNKRNDLYDKYLEAKENNKYEDAIEYLYEYSSLLRENDPDILCLIAILYCNLNNYQKAFKIFKLASFQYLRPEYLIEFIKCGYKIEEYEKVIDLCNYYNSIYKSDNKYIYYVMSCAFNNMGRGIEAKDVLETSSILDCLESDFEVDYRLEWDAINNKKRYDISEYYDFSYDVSEEIEKDILLNGVKERNYFLGQNDYIEYLLKVLKVYKRYNEYELFRNYLDIYEYEIKDLKSIKYEKVSNTYNNLLNFILS